MNEKESLHFERYMKTLSKTVREATRQLEAKWNGWKIDTSKIEMHEVIGALLARQLSVVKCFSHSPGIWNNELAPAVLRILTDNYITFEWILIKPLERSQKFIEHGLGMEKLQMEKRISHLEEQGLNPDDDELVKFQKDWINYHRYDFLTTVDLGKWSGINTRDMAIEANCKSFYDLVFDPFSVCVHSYWGHVGKHNITLSLNPLHKGLRQPVMPQEEILPYYPDLSIKYLSMMYSAFDKIFSDKPDRSIIDFHNEVLEAEFGDEEE